MKTPFSLLKISALATSALLLTACGSDDDSSSDSHDAHEEHAHALMISQTNSAALSFLEEDELEGLDTDAAANAATLLLSDTGESAAVITANAVQFVAEHHEEEEGEEEAHDEEEHELPEVVSIAGQDSGVTNVINSNGHFSVLVNGTTQFVPYEALEEENPEAETVAYTVDEEYPALLLHEDEEHGLLTLVFDGTNAVIYEGATASVEAAHTKTCGTVNSTAHVGEFAVVSCDNVTYSVKVEEVSGEHEAEIATIAGITTAVEWKSRAGVFVGLGADDKFYVLEEENEALVLEGTAFDTPANLCDWGIDSSAADIFALTASALTVHSHEGVQEVSLTLDESPSATCNDLAMATATQAVFVLDNSASKLYEIDKEEGAALYHVHGREDLPVSDVESAVNFHEVGSEAGHEH